MKLSKLIPFCFLFILIIGCKKDDSSVNDGFSFSNLFSKDRVLEQELIKEGLIYFYKNEPFNGIAFGMYDANKIKFEKAFIDGKEEGLQRHWYGNGQIRSEEFVKNERPDGKYKTWFENGQLEVETNYVNNNINGTYESFYENGQQESESKYEIIEERDLVPAVTSEGKETFIDQGKKTSSIEIGKSITWYKNGQLNTERNYVKGNLIGLQIAWRENGTVYEKLNLKKGEKIDYWRRWYQNGQLAFERIGEMKTNKNTTKFSEKEWWDNGVLKSETINIGNSFIIKHYSQQGIMERVADTINSSTSLYKSFVMDN